MSTMPYLFLLCVLFLNLLVACKTQEDCDSFVNRTWKTDTYTVYIEDSTLNFIEGSDTTTIYYLYQDAQIYYAWDVWAVLVVDCDQLTVHSQKDGVIHFWETK